MNSAQIELYAKVWEFVADREAAGPRFLNRMAALGRPAPKEAPSFNAAVKNGDAEMYVLDEIGPSWLGMVGAKGFAAELKALGDIKTLRLYVQSPGGDVFEGLAIYNLLANSKARVTVDVIGMAASAAGIITMAGDEIRIAESAKLMVHNAWTMVAGESKDLRAAADLLDNIKDSLVGILADRSRNTREKVSDWMDAETWFSAKEALSNGFANSIVPNKTPPANAFNSADRRLRLLEAEHQLAG